MAQDEPDHAGEFSWPQPQTGRDTGAGDRAVPTDDVGAAPSRGGEVRSFHDRLGNTAGSPSLRDLPSGVKVGLALGLASIVVLYVWFSENVEQPGLATLCVFGVPVVFTGARLRLFLSGRMRTNTRWLWPMDREHGPGWGPRALSVGQHLGLSLVGLNMVIAYFAAAMAADDMLFDGAVSGFLDHFAT